LQQVLDGWTQAILMALGADPDRYASSSRWVQAMVTWLAHRYLTEEKDLWLLRLEEQIAAPGVELLTAIFNRTPRTILPEDAPASKILAELIGVTEKLGWIGVWVHVDGLGKWANLDRTSLGQFLDYLLSTLALFEIPGFAIKLMCPLELKPTILASAGRQYFRCSEYPVIWSEDQLIQIAERRLFLATGDDLSLADLCSAPDFLPWLARYGGKSPRGWLEILRPLVDEYLRRENPRPLDEAFWRDNLRRYPPPLTLNRENDSVLLGYARIENIQPAGLKLLKYLYTHPNRQCTREELYFKGYRGFQYIPRAKDDTRYEPLVTWERVLDTALSRLRQVLEPASENPIYVVSDKGRSTVRLENSR
jgi:hypothetical protein